MPDDAPRWTVVAWHCSCHAVNWRRYSHGAPGTEPFGIVGGLFSYQTVEEFLADGHRDLIPVDVDKVAALLADFHDLDAEHAKTVSNFEEHAEATAEQAADARHEVEVLRSERDAARVEAGIALAERDEARAERDQLTFDLTQARRDAASWEDWGRGWKGQAQAGQTERDKAWADLDAVTAERDRRSAELKRVQAVVDAALAWRDWLADGRHLLGAEGRLAAAVDVLRGAP